METKNSSTRPATAERIRVTTFAGSTYTAPIAAVSVHGETLFCPSWLMRFNLIENDNCPRQLPPHIIKTIEYF